jgi:hypothetical protein
LLQLPDIAKDAAPHALVGEIAKEALHLKSFFAYRNPSSAGSSAA